MTASMRSLMNLFESANEEQIEEFMGGYCHALALAINELKGWPIVVVWMRDMNPRAEPFHVANQMPDGRLIDVRGPAADFEALSDDYSWSSGKLKPSSPKQIASLIASRALMGIPEAVMADARTLAAMLTA